MYNIMIIQYRFLISPPQDLLLQISVFIASIENLIIKLYTYMYRYNYKFKSRTEGVHLYMWVFSYDFEV